MLLFSYKEKFGVIGSVYSFIDLIYEDNILFFYIGLGVRVNSFLSYYSFFYF